MAPLPKGTLNEAVNAAKNTTVTEDAVIKVVPPPVPDGSGADAAPTEAPTIAKEPTTETDSKPKQEKEPCTLCKAQSIAKVAFSFSLVLLVLAFSFSLVKKDK